MVTKRKIILPFLLIGLIVLIGTNALPNAHSQEQGIFRVNEHNIRHSHNVRVQDLLPVYVSRVVDGDTIIVLINNPPAGLARRERVRFLGVDAPETVHSSRPPEHFGWESTEFTRSALEGKNVYLAFDWNLRDRFGRLLAYVYLPDGTCFNAMQIKFGYAHAYIRFPFQFLEEFREYEAKARAEKLGLWR